LLRIEGTDTSDTAKIYSLNVKGNLDPLSNKTEEEKLLIIGSRGTTREMYVISSNIRSFLLIAIEQEPDFLMKTREEKMAKLTELANGITQITGQTGAAQTPIA